MISVLKNDLGLIKTLIMSSEAASSGGNVSASETKYVDTFSKLFLLLEALSSELQKRGHSTTPPSLIRTTAGIYISSIKNTDKDQNVTKRKAISSFLNIMNYRNELKANNVSFFEENMVKIFNLPEDLAKLATSIFQCRDKDGNLDVPSSYSEKLFRGMTVLCQTGLEVLTETGVDNAAELFRQLDKDSDIIDTLSNLDLGHRRSEWLD